MQKAFIIIMLGVLFASGCIPTGDVFGAYTRGVESAQRANELDRQRAIAFDISHFNQTGDYRALCHAAMLGSGEAANHLRQNRIGCQTYEQDGQRFIQAVNL